MLSRRNLVMMLTMFGVVLLLFLSTAVLREYFNDYDVNHAAQEERILPAAGASAADGQQVVYAGAQDTGLYEPVAEWAEYRKMALHEAMDVQTGLDRAGQYDNQDVLLLLDGDALEQDTQQSAEALTAYVQDGGTVIFCSLPSYETIQSCEALRLLLGIQQLRSPSVEVLEYWLYQGFLLGGDVCYPYDELQPPKNLDIENVLPWYDISAGTKTYMAGYLPAQEQQAMGLNREDLPAVVWRNSLGDGCVFAVNGDFMRGESALGFLDAMVYESRSYALYAVVNAQNLCVTGFPDLTVENEDQMARMYVFNTRQLCRDVLWPSLVAASREGGWKLSAFVSLKQSAGSGKEPEMDDLISYLKYFNEEDAEACLALGRMDDPNLRLSVTQDRQALDAIGLNYAFSGAWLRSENAGQLPGLLQPDGTMDVFPSIRTVVNELVPGQRVLSWLTGQMTRQSVTMDGYRYTYQDDLRLRSLQTALGYSNVQADIFRVLWLENSEDSWEKVSETLASVIATYWKPFAAFDKTTISESDRRVRLFLNQRVTSQESRLPQGRQISIQVENFAGDAWLMLRTHGETLQTMEGGTWTQIEEDAYLLHLTRENAAVGLQSKLQPHYS